MIHLYFKNTENNFEVKQTFAFDIEKMLQVAFTFNFYCSKSTFETE